MVIYSELGYKKKCVTVCSKNVIVSCLHNVIQWYYQMGVVSRERGWRGRWINRWRWVIKPWGWTNAGLIGHMLILTSIPASTVTFCVSLTYSYHCTCMEVLSRVNTHMQAKIRSYVQAPVGVLHLWWLHIIYADTYSQSLSPLRSLLIFPLSPLSFNQRWTWCIYRSHSNTRYDVKHFLF